MNEPNDDLALHITQIIFDGTFWRFAFNCHVPTPIFFHNITLHHLRSSFRRLCVLSIPLPKQTSPPFS